VLGVIGQFPYLVRSGRFKDMKMKISDIKIGNRFRKDLGDIHALADSIKDIGLLQPIVINENNELIAGQRRIDACKYLGWTEIPTYTVNLENIIAGEFHENELRKDFSYTERVAILEEIERRRVGHKPRKGCKFNTLSRGKQG